MKIYDCFTFFNELDLLNLRLEIIYPYVNKIILVEMDKTFSGKEKPFYFEKNKERFKKYLDKIIHIKLKCGIERDFFEKNGWLLKNKIFRIFVNRLELGKWRREVFQRDGIMKGLNDCNYDDIILISDVDEIPDPERLNEIKEILKKNRSLRIGLKQIMFIYYLNGLTDFNWIGTKAVTYSNLKNKFKSSPQKVRILKDIFLRIKNSDIILKKGGWHFSYIGGKEKIKEKINSFAESEKIDIKEDYFKIGKNESNINYISIENKLFPIQIQNTKYKKLIK